MRWMVHNVLLVDLIEVCLFFRFPLIILLLHEKTELGAGPVMRGKIFCFWPLLRLAVVFGAVFENVILVDRLHGVVQV